MLSTEHVGAVVGAELLKQALWAVFWSLVAIMLYRLAVVMPLKASFCPPLVVAAT